MPVGHPGVEAALLLDVRAGAGAGGGAADELGKRVDDLLGADVGQPERAESGGVDDPAAAGQRQCHRRRGGVAAPACGVVDASGRAERSGHERVDEGRLADARRAEEHAEVVAQDRAELRQVAVAVEHHGVDVEREVVGQQRRRRGEVALGEHEKRGEARVERSDQRAVDEARLRRWLGEGHHHGESVGIRHDDALDRVGVIGGAAQRGGAGLDPHDARKGVGGARQVAHEGDTVADDHPLAAELARLDRHQASGLHVVGTLVVRVALDAGEAAAVDPDHEAGPGVGVLGAVLRPGA